MKLFKKLIYQHFMIGILLLTLIALWGVGRSMHSLIRNTPNDIRRLNTVSWNEIRVWYGVENRIDNQQREIRNILINDKTILTELQHLFKINESFFLPTIAYTAANRIHLVLDNGEVFILIVGQNSLAKISNIICYNNNRQTESYRMNINTDFLLALKNIIHSQTNNEITNFPQ